MAEATVRQGVFLSGDAIAAALEGFGDLEGLCTSIDSLFEQIGQRFSVAMADTISENVEQALLGASEEVIANARDWAFRASRNGSPVALWVRAVSLGSTQEAGVAWDEAVAALPRVVPEALLYRSRIRLRAGDAQGSAEDLRLALLQPCGYELWSRAEKILRRLARHAPPTVRALRLAVLGGQASTALLTPLLRVACFRDRIGVELYESDYDHWQQDILDPASELYRFEPDVVLLATHWRDAGLPVHSPEPEAAVQGVVQRWLQLWKTLHARHTCTIIAHGFDLPTQDPYGRLGTALAGGRGSLLLEINTRLRRETSSNDYLLDLDAVARETGSFDWCDARRWYSARQHPGPTGLVPLVEHQVALIRATLGLSRKVAVLDLDNTLWGGVIGEDGIEGIQLGPPSAIGEAHQNFQAYLKALRDRGILLAVCSKNNPEDAREPFRSHPETILQLEDFVAFEANWEEKATNIQHIADQLSLGLDSFIFIDDNPVERAWVREQLPDVIVPELPADPADYVSELERGRFFEAVGLSDEDRQRSESYRAEIDRRELRKTTASLDDFLENLGMIAQDGPFDEQNLPRIAQLVNKTNQFSLTTRRYSEAQLKCQANDPAWWTRWFRLRDRFRDSGLIGVMTARTLEDEDSAIEIDNWLMSCRVLGRKMEAHMLGTAISHCRDRGIQRIIGRYIPTGKNAQVAQLYEKSGFSRHPDAADGESAWVLDVNMANLPDSPIATEGEN